MILIGGCSWACGEWTPNGNGGCDITHGGLSQFISYGQECVNLGKPSISNLVGSHKIQKWLKNNPDVAVDKVFFFQTDWLRDNASLTRRDYDNVQHHLSLFDILMTKFYDSLEFLAQERQCTIYIIGGVGDTYQAERVESRYSRVKVACQSMTNLLLNDQADIDNPVHSWFVSNFYELDQFKSKLSADEIKNLLLDIDQGIARQDQIAHNEKYFHPDGSHPNRFGHKKLFEFLSKKGVI